MDILAFGIVREMTGGKSISIELPEKSTVIDLKQKLESTFPKIKTLASFLIAVNDEYADDSQLLHPEDEIAIIPPVSGG